MFSKFFRFFVTVEHDVEAIISSFTKTVERLEQAAEAHTKAAEKYAEEAVHYERLSGGASDASKRAKDVAGKIRALVS